MTVYLPPTANPGQPLLTKGAWYMNTPSALAAGVGGNGTLRVAPWQIATFTFVDGLACEVTVAGEAGAKFVACVYASNPAGTPGKLIAWAMVNADGIGVLTANILRIPIAPGVYWVGGVCQAVPVTAPTMRTIDSGAVNLVPGNTDNPPGVVSTVGYATNGVAGALPDPFPAVSSPVSSIARIGLRVAA